MPSLEHASTSEFEATADTTSSSEYDLAQQDREELATAFRLAEKFGFHEGICNHFSVRLDTRTERYLINPYGVHWSQLEADSLLMIDGEGNILAGHGFVEDTARFIHVAGHRANPRHKALFHTHMPYATTLTMLNGESAHLPMTHQTAVRFFERITYETEFGGLALDEQEGQRIAEKAARSPHADITFLANHGVVVGGPSVAVAFDDLYYLERACRQHVFALQTGLPLKLIPEHIVKHTAEQSNQQLVEFADQHFKALGQVLKANPGHVFTF
jgi:ribulose-5-phosphate 4-epimerase/fuculose-1-phosphate aldolase